MDRMTRERLEMAYAAYLRTLGQAGVPTADYELVTGSVVNGNAWGLRRASGKRCLGTYDGFLGSTAREAYNTLHVITKTVLDVTERP